jgi:hypothetical protein
LVSFGSRIGLFMVSLERPQRSHLVSFFGSRTSKDPNETKIRPKRDRLDHN